VPASIMVTAVKAADLICPIIMYAQNAQASSMTKEEAQYIFKLNRKPLDMRATLANKRKELRGSNTARPNLAQRKNSCPRWMCR
jgi:hypothetical protein